MEFTFAQSGLAQHARQMIENLQLRFKDKLSKLDSEPEFETAKWFRDEGQHGGGTRFEGKSGSFFNRASINFSQVHYDDLPDKSLSSATALSTIVHPANPLHPSVHIHISWTELRSGRGYWRMMADLNPSVPNASDNETFTRAMKTVAPDLYQEAAEQGDKYFYIPVLERHRGITHFYLENFSTQNISADRSLAQQFGESVIDAYVSLLRQAIKEKREPGAADLATQLAYHTLYFFQVVTLDRGTTSGLLVHSQNDIGILGSLPAKVDKLLLKSWIVKMPKPQDLLLRSLIDCLDDGAHSVINEDTKCQLAKVIREHYRLYPEAINLQASGDTVPTTVENHS